MIWLYVGIPYLCLMLFVVFYQRRLMYHPTVAADLSVEKCRLDPDKNRDVTIQSDDGTLLKGWLLLYEGDRSEGKKSPLILYFPGNAANRFERLTDLQEFTNAGFDLLIVDYRGYGDSAGSPTEYRLEQDARQVWQFAQRELKYDASRIVVFGESLGGAVAIALCVTDAVPAAVILNSTFSTMADVAAWHFPWLPVRYLLLDRWPSTKRIGLINSPMILFHGTADEIVPYALGQKLASSTSNGRLITVENGTHNAMPMGQIRQELQQIRDRLLSDDTSNPQSAP